MAGNARYTALLDACVLFPIAGHADCIVTTNVRDFPAESIAPYGIEALDVDCPRPYLALPLQRR